MPLIDFLRELDEEVQAVNSSDFEVEIIETNFVPSFSDPNITYDNLDTKKKKWALRGIVWVCFTVITYRSTLSA